MKRYFIEDAKFGIAECDNDWITGEHAAAIKFRTDDKTNWISAITSAGILNVYITDDDIWDDLLDLLLEDEERIKYLNDHCIENFNGIACTFVYSDVYESIYNDPENPAVPLIKLLLLLLSGADDDSTGEITVRAIGKYADELDLPTCEAEQEYLDELEDEGDEEED